MFDDDDNDDDDDDVRTGPYICASCIMHHDSTNAEHAHKSNCPGFEKAGDPALFSFSLGVSRYGGWCSGSTVIVDLGSSDFQSL